MSKHSSRMTNNYLDRRILEESLIKSSIIDNGNFDDRQNKSGKVKNEIDEHVELICDLFYETRTYKLQETFSIYKIVKDLFNSCCKRKKAKKVKKQTVEEFFKSKSKALQKIYRSNENIDGKNKKDLDKNDNYLSNFFIVDKDHHSWYKNLDSLHTLFYFLNSISNEELLCWINRFFNMFTKDDSFFMNDRQFRNFIDYADVKIGVSRMAIIIRSIDRDDFANWTNFDRILSDELTKRKITSCGPFTFQAIFSLLKHNCLRKYHVENNVRETKLESVIDYQKFFPYLFLIYIELCFAKIEEYKDKFCIVLGTDSEGEPLNENTGSLYDIFSTDLNYQWLDQKINLKAIQNGIQKYCLINREHITQEQTNLLISEIQQTILCDPEFSRHNIHDPQIYNNLEDIESTKKPAFEVNFEEEEFQQNSGEMSFSLLKILKWIAQRLCIIMNLNVQSITSKNFSANYTEIDNIMRDLQNKKTETLKNNQSKLIEECLLWYTATSQFFDRVILKKDWDKFVKKYSYNNLQDMNKMKDQEAKEQIKNLIYDFLQEKLPFIHEDTCARFYQQYDSVKQSEFIANVLFRFVNQK